MRSLIALIFGAIFSTCAYAQTNPLPEAHTYFYSNGVLYSAETRRQSVTAVDLQSLNLTVDNAALSQHQFLQDSEHYDLKAYLIENDLARLKNSVGEDQRYLVLDRAAAERSRQRAEAASEAAQARARQIQEEAEAAEKAKAERDRQIASTLSSIGSTIQAASPWVGGFSALGLLIFLALSRLAVVIVTGLRGAGKTGVYRVLKDPKTPQHILLALDPTPEVERFQNVRPITKNLFQHFVRLIDLPGKRLGEWSDLVANNLFWRVFSPFIRLVYIVVLAPTAGNSGTRDEAFIWRQHGFVESQVLDQLQAKNKRKPTKIIVFVNKADTVQSGGNSVSRDVRADLQNTFAAHIAMIKKQVRESNSNRWFKTRVDVEIGSVAFGWETGRLMDMALGNEGEV